MTHARPARPRKRGRMDSRPRACATPHPRPINAPARPASVTVNASPNPVAAQLRKLAAGLQRRIDDGNRPMTQALTAKRSRQYAQRRWEAANQSRTQHALRALADAHERGDVPDELAGLRRVADVAPLVYKGVEGGRGYYECVPMTTYRDESPAGRRLQAMVDVLESPAGRMAAEIERREIDARLANLPGFYPTPAAVARRMAELADIQPRERVLEPSAGSGRLVDAILAAAPHAFVDACETSQDLRDLLELKRRATPVGGRMAIVGRDFLELAGPPVYDVVMMNPPFEKADDIRHVVHAWTHHLKPGGRLVAIVSDGALYRTDRLAQSFRALVGEASDDPEGFNLPGGTFDDTNVSARVVVLRKPVAIVAPETPGDAWSCSCTRPQPFLFNELNEAVASRTLRSTPDQSTSARVRGQCRATRCWPSRRGPRCDA